MPSEPAPAPMGLGVDIMNDPAYAPNSGSNRTAEQDHCRICRSEGSAEEPLFHPCKCSGSIKFVHQECLMEWLQHSQKKYCELCKTPFTFTKVYDPNMPAALPTLLFLKQLARHGINSVILWLRGVLVISVWLGCLPLGIRWMWQGWFWVSDGGWWTVADPSNVEAPLQSSVESSAPAAATKTAAAGSLLAQLVPAFMRQNSASLGSNVTATDLATENMTAPQNPFEYRHGLFFDTNPFGNFTTSPTMNRLFVDILEGQLLTALIVVSFIIVFLIREWVVQQQPALDGMNFPLPEENLVDDDAEGEMHGPHQAEPEEPEDQDEEDEEAETELVPLLAEEDENDAAAPQDRVIARPRRRRAFNLDQEAEGDGENTGEGSSSDQPSATGDEDDAATSTGYNFGEARSRPQPTRQNTAQAANLRREIEETTRDTTPVPAFDFAAGNADSPFRFGAPSNAEASGSTSTKEPEHEDEHARDSDDAFPEAKGKDIWRDRHDELETIDTGRTREWRRDSLGEMPVEGPARSRAASVSSPAATGVQEIPTTAPVSKNSSWSSGDSFELIFGPKTDGHAGPSSEQNGTSNNPEPGNEAHSSNDGDKDSEWESDDDDEARVEPLHNSHWSTSAQASDTTPAPSDMGATVPFNFDPPAPNPLISNELEERIRRFDPRVQDFVRQLAIDGQLPEAELRRLLDSLANRAEGQPDFVHGRGRRGLDLFAGLDPTRNVPEQNQDDPEEADEDTDDEQDNEIGAGGAENPMDGNLNDAVEDENADDFDGIMDLVGMRGPIVGLVQNAAISSVLITATVAIGVAFPYVAGKTMMMILAHPILFFFRLPVVILGFCAELAVDTATLIGFSALLMVEQSLRFLIKPVSFVVPSLSEFADQSALTGWLEGWAQGGQERVVSKFVALETTYGAMRQYPPSAVPPLGMVFEDAMNRFTSVIVKTLARFGIATPVALGLGPEKLDVGAFNVTNPLVWATRSIEDTFASVNFTKPENASAIIAPSTLPEFTTTLQVEPYVLHRWSTIDRVVVVLLGYITFTVIGMIYVRRRRNLEARSFERHLVDFLEQSGGVMKVILIIGIEMFLFPLYCGMLLDLAMLPLFPGATLATRLQFLIDFPLTSVFVHWFVGTCYMFHFALFVSMCRKIMRSGVLYFIRDPDDPTFHPVRDVLDRPVITQLRKIVFSGAIYGVLVLVCLGGVVWGLHGITTGILPIHWSSTEPVLEFPIDLLFYNFFMPFTVKYIKPSAVLTEMYGWWFKVCARALRLTGFMFGKRTKDEEGYHHYPSWLSLLKMERGDPETPVLPGQEAPEKTVYFQRTGRFVRAPASDSVRRPRNTAVFIPVDEDNNRLDTESHIDPTATSPDWKVVYIPPYFRARITIFILGIWAFAAVTGVSVTIGPLMLGRWVLHKHIPKHVSLNDIYAFSVGVYISGAAAFLISKIPSSYSTLLTLFKSLRHSSSKSAALNTALYRFAKLLYLSIAIGIVIPTLLALLIEAYVIVPLHTYFVPAPSVTVDRGTSHTVHFVQDWMLGVLYLKMAARMLLLSEEAPLARQLRAVVADGWYNPNLRIATKTFIAPILGTLFAALTVPFAGAWMALKVWGGEEVLVYRYAFPVAAAVAAVLGLVYALGVLLEGWRGKVRDEVYLRGVVVHNFGEKARSEGRVM